MCVLPSLATYFIGLILGKYAIDGILWLLWSFTIITVFAALLVTFKFREDTVHFQSVFQSVKSLLNGMKQIWFRKNPGIIVGPITLTFTLYVLTYGSYLILVLYLSAPPLSLTPSEYGAFSTFRYCSGTILGHRCL